ncbi:MAG TPA: hypothetical protein ENF28_04605 [Proteobacteria bacterium]|nr:MAG: hypothetical protein DRG80_07775 [Deltaproteobacteria bacterium]HDJ28511.1 hypothetical protein [Pseudomonadota bacterium]
MGNEKHQMKREAVKMKLSDGSMIYGEVNLLSEGGVSRLSELFTKSESPFIVVFNATKQGREGQLYVVSKSHIIWVSPVE